MKFYGKPKEIKQDLDDLISQGKLDDESYNNNCDLLEEVDGRKNYYGKMAGDKQLKLKEDYRDENIDFNHGFNIYL